MGSWSPLTKLMLLIGVVAIPYLLWTMQSGTPVVAGVRHASAAAEVGEPEPSPPVERRVLPPLQTFAAMVERPLFTPTRRLVRPVEAAAVEPEPEPVAETPDAPPAAGEAGPPATPRPELRFFGTMTQGRRTFALVTQIGESGVKRLGVGDGVGPWKVTSVTRDHLTLGHEGDEVAYAIFGQSGAAGGSGGAKTEPAAGTEDESDQNDNADSGGSE